MRNTAVFVSLSKFRAKAPGPSASADAAGVFNGPTLSGLWPYREGVLEVVSLGPVAQLVRARA